MADGAEQIAKPENCIVAVAQRVKNANVYISLRPDDFTTEGASGAKDWHE
jgi:hypothetical protein